MSACSNSTTSMPAPPSMSDALAGPLPRESFLCKPSAKGTLKGFTTIQKLRKKFVRAGSGRTAFDIVRAPSRRSTKQPFRERTARRLYTQAAMDFASPFLRGVLAGVVGLLTQPLVAVLLVAMVAAGILLRRRQ